MNWLNLILIFGFDFICQTISQGFEEETNSDMYQKLNNPHACFRRLNGTHQVGCSSPREGSRGVIQLVTNETELNWLIYEAHAGPYVAVVSSSIFANKSAIESIIKSGKVSGMLVILDPKSRPFTYSPDNTCPNNDFGMDTCDPKYNWNPFGLDYLFMDWPIPIFLVDLDTADKVTQCYKKFNLPLDELQSSRNLCSLQLRSHMLAAVNAETCISRSRSSIVAKLFFTGVIFCDPLGDQTVLLPYGRLDKFDPKSVIIVAAKLDTLTLFDGYSPGAMSTVSGIATILATAHILSKMIPDSLIRDKTILFTLFNGETVDFIGSSRFVYNMSNNNMFITMDSSITFENIMLFVDVSQVGPDSTFFMHLTNDTVSKSFYSDVEQKAKSLNLKMREGGGNIPPTSFRVFRGADPTMPGAVVTNYDTSFVNKYYNGIFDDNDNLEYEYNSTTSVVQKNIAALSVSLASALYKQVTGQEYTEDLGSFTEIVDEILYCYLNTSSCPLINQTSTTEIDGGFTGVLPLYISPHNTYNRVTTLTGLLLEYLASPRVNLTKSQCKSTSDHKKSFIYAWMKGVDGKGECINTTLKFIPAVSPAFLIEGYNWTSGVYSTWTESQWSDITLIMYLKPSSTQEIVTLSLGLSCLISSFLIVYWLSSHSDTIFTPDCPTSC